MTRASLKMLTEMKVHNVRLMERFSEDTWAGILYLTATHLIFVDSEGKGEIWMLHMHIGHIEKRAANFCGYTLRIRGKNFLCLHFIIPWEKDCLDIYRSLVALSRPAHMDRLYAFTFTSNENLDRTRGWDAFSLPAEFLRMGAPNSRWVVTNLNKRYELCDTYPSFLLVPSSATAHILIASSHFRSKGRLPVLTYLHSGNQAALVRCSQPLAGFSARCMEDEQMLGTILKTNPNSDFLYVVDTRPKVNAVIHLTQGRGFDRENCYSNIKFQFLGLENIHVIRSSLNKIMDISELKKPTVNEFWSCVESSGWLKHVAAVLETSAFIAKAVSEGTSVLVHCSDGCDQTSQVCSLAQLMLDPYYRTFYGFQALIEKDWLSFGHKFTDRCGLLESVDVRETGPIFTQFLDCVWQVWQQVPCAFEFNERFLLTLHDHVFSCQFGTFVGNCEKDRKDLRLSRKTYSLWGYVSHHSSEFLNPLYKKLYEMKQPVVIPNTAPPALRFWLGMYNRFDGGLQPRESVMDILSSARDHSASLEDHVHLLEKRVSQICRLLGKTEEMVQRKLQSNLSSDCVDGYLSAHFGDIPSMPSPRSHHPEESTYRPSFNSEPHLSRRSSHYDRVPFSQLRSDSESGYDESSSQMSRSGYDDSGVYTGMDASYGMVGPRCLSLDQLIAELKTVAIVWKPLQKVHICSCGTPFDHHVRKTHCWKCGEVFCVRCLAGRVSLPGHYHHRPVPVCKPCSKEVHRIQNTEFLQR